MYDDDMPMGAAAIMIVLLAFLVAFSFSIFVRKPNHIIIDSPNKVIIEPDGTVREEKNE